MSQQLKLTLVKSSIGILKKHKACLKGLGLKKIRQSVVIDATPENLGMVNKINYLLKKEEVVS